MSSPPIQVFLTTIASQPALRQRQEYILRILQIRKIPFTSYDLASNEDAKMLWKRKVPSAKQQLPGILVGGMFPGTYDDFEAAVEYGELDTFLRLKESWTETEATHTLAVMPVGVPGASSPSQMTTHKPSFASSPAPSPLKDRSKKGEELDAGTTLGDMGLQGVSVTDAELADLVAELGLEGDVADDLLKGLSVSREPEPEAFAKEANEVVTERAIERPSTHITEAAEPPAVAKNEGVAEKDSHSPAAKPEATDKEKEEGVLAEERK